MVVYSGSYLRNIPSGIMRFVVSGNAAITIQELIGVGNSGLYLETRRSYIFLSKVQAVKRVNCEAQCVVPRSFWIELVGVKDAVVPFVFRFESREFFEKVNAVTTEAKNLFAPYSAVGLVYLRPTRSTVLRVESIDKFAVFSLDGRVDHVVHFEDGRDNVLAGVEVFYAGRTLELLSYEASI